MKFTITPLGGTGRSVRRIADGIVAYLLPGRAQQPAGGVATPAGTGGHPESFDRTGVVRYYADSGEGGRWSGRGAEALGLRGEVRAADFATVLTGRDPRTGQRLITAQGSAGRRPRLGVGAETRRSPDGEGLYGARDAAALLGLPRQQVARMIEIGTMLALARAFGLPVRDQPGGSYLAPLIDNHGERWVTDGELARCEDALRDGVSAREIASHGPAHELVPLAEAARLVGLTPRYLRRLAKRYETNRASIDAAVTDGRAVHEAYLVAVRDPRGRWLVSRGELAAFLERRRPPVVRVAYDATLTTEKSLGVLALLSEEPTRRAVLDAIRAGNDWALAWLERHVAAARANGEIVAVKGWTVASFQHHTSRALDPFPHHHNVICNTVEDLHGERRALDARGLYDNAKAASALATAEMRHRLTHALGVRWRRAHHRGWEVAGITPEVLREFSRRSNEIDDALRELEEIIGRGATPDEFDQVKTTTRPDKTHVPLDELLADWRRRAQALGLAPKQLAACLGMGPEPVDPDPETLYALLAAPEGICANRSIFDRGDVLAALVDLPVRQPGKQRPGRDQPPLVSAARLEQLADGFLASRHVEQIAPGRWSTREMLVVQDRIVARYRHGRHRGAGRVPDTTIGQALARHPQLTGEQRALVRAFCSSGHRIQCAVGHPGAGKTTAMAAARDAWHAAGWRVLGAAVKGDAARGLAAATGIPTETLAWYLAHDDPQRMPFDARTVLVVDEASTISDRDLDRLGWQAAQTGATLRLIGDPAQHGAVEAGGMFRVLCEHHPGDTLQLTATHRLQDPHDRAAAAALRAGDVTRALRELDAAGHLHVVDDELHGYTAVLAHWWHAHQSGLDHPMVSRQNDARRSLNRLGHQLRRAAGEVDGAEIQAADDRRYSVGDRVIARIPNRTLHPPGRPDAYVRNGSVGTITAIAQRRYAQRGHITVDFDDIGRIVLPRSFFDEHVDQRGRRRVGLDHAYAVTSYAITGATHTVSTSRIDQTSSRAEAYVDVTRGRHANHLYLTRRADDNDGEHLPRPPADPIDETIAARLASSQGERTAWETREQMRQRPAGAVLEL